MTLARVCLPSWPPPGAVRKPRGISYCSLSANFSICIFTQESSTGFTSPIMLQILDHLLYPRRVRVQVAGRCCQVGVAQYRL